MVNLLQLCIYPHLISPQSVMLSPIYLITYLLSGGGTWALQPLEVSSHTPSSVASMTKSSDAAAAAAPTAATSRCLTPSLLLSLSLSLHPFLLLFSIQRLQLRWACSVLLPNLLQSLNTDDDWFDSGKIGNCSTFASIKTDEDGKNKY